MIIINYIIIIPEGVVVEIVEDGCSEFELDDTGKSNSYNTCH